jgi:hypothetical protein
MEAANLSVSDEDLGKLQCATFKYFREEISPANGLDSG